MIYSVEFVIEDNCVDKNAASMKQRYAVPPREYPVIMLKLCAHKMLKSYQKDTCTASPHCFKHFSSCVASFTAFMAGKV